MIWKIVAAERFASAFKRHKKNRAVVVALDKKLDRLRKNPEQVGGYLGNDLHGYKSTRILGKLRLLFRTDPATRTVFLIDIDHRKFDYARFSPS